jgi:cystathionine gamma-synthase
MTVGRAYNTNIHLTHLCLIVQVTISTPHTNPDQYLIMTYHPSTVAVHADDRTNIITDVAPPIHTATTFRYPKNPDDYQPAPTEGEYLDHSTPLVYSRLTNSNINRLETILTPLIYPGAREEELPSLGNHVITYSSGLSAFHALLVNIVPKVIAISGGYHGCHGV